MVNRWWKRPRSKLFFGERGSISGIRIARAGSGRGVRVGSSHCRGPERGSPERAARPPMPRDGAGIRRGRVPVSRCSASGRGPPGASPAATQPGWELQGKIWVVYLFVIVLSSFFKGVGDGNSQWKFGWRGEKSVILVLGRVVGLLLFLQGKKKKRKIKRKRKRGRGRRKYKKEQEEKGKRETEK